jgi:hypothetical protein
MIVMIDRMIKKTAYATVPLKHQGLLLKISYYTYIIYGILLKYRTKEILGKAKQYTGIFLPGRDFFQEKQSYLLTESPLFKYEGETTPFTFLC